MYCCTVYCLIKLQDSYALEIESLQVALLKQLLDNTDGTDKRPSSRAMFLRRLRMHLRDIVRVSILYVILVKNYVM